MGQLLSKGYSAMSENNKFIISDSQEKNQVISITRSRNNMFLLDIAKVESLSMVVRNQTPDELWHLWFDHLNYKSLMSLA